jgi:hypothetical protein
VHREPRRFAGRLQKGESRALSIGARDMHHAGEKFFGIAERGQQSFNASKREIDDPRMIRPQPFDEMVTPQRGALRSGSRRDRRRLLWAL